ncbi:MAG: ClpXP protease specificity-enhancing factor SspB [Bacteroidota bacterium]
MTNNFNTYSEIVQYSLYDVIQKILTMVINREISDYCIYITFYKSHEENLFPSECFEDDEVTIVLENRFWNLKVGEDGFEVDIEIKKRKENIYISYDSILIFSDQNSNFIIDFRPLYEKVEEENLKQNVIFVEIPSSKD